MHAYIVFGGDKGDRTPDLCIANASLSQLSYIPNVFDETRYSIKLFKMQQVFLLQNVMFFDFKKNGKSDYIKEL